MTEITNLEFVAIVISLIIAFVLGILTGYEIRGRKK